MTKGGRANPSTSVGDLPKSPGLARFGVFEVDFRVGELRKNGLKVRLQEQPLQVLAALLETPGELVTREELKEKLWPEHTYVDFDLGLNTAVKKLRQALADSPRSPRFIETLPRRGYRFIADVQRDGKQESALSNIGANGGLGGAQAIVGAQVDPSPRRIARLAVAASSCAVAAALAAFLWFRGSDPALEPDAFSVATLTSYPGRETGPSFSPDGSQIAFAWTGDEGENHDIYVKFAEPGSGAPRRITDDPAMDFSPAWSPDGRSIAFLRSLTDNTAGVMLVSALGSGPERKLFETDAFESAPGSPTRTATNPGYSSGLIAWSPDGKWLALPGRPEQAGPARLMALEVESGDFHWLTSPPAGTIGDASPAFSPDGSALAFVRHAGWFSANHIFILPLSENLEPAAESQALAAQSRDSRYPVWMPGGKELVFFSRPVSGKHGLRAVSVSGERPPRLWWPEQGIGALAISQRKNDLRLAYVLSRFDTDVWSVDVAGPSPGKPQRLISSTQHDSGMQFSPDGTKVAFSSARSGIAEIWVCDRDGSNPRRLTNLMKAFLPRWSPDGRQIAFHSRSRGQADVYVINANGGVPRRITTDLADDAAPSWSRDGEWIYFGSARTGSWQVWRVAADGGEQVQITQSGGFSPFESTDSQALYYYRPGIHELWMMPIVDGHPAGPGRRLATEVMDFPSFSVVQGGVFFLSQSGTVHFVDPALGTTSEVVKLDVPSGVIGDDFCVSPDGQTILYSQQVVDSDLMLLESVR